MPKWQIWIYNFMSIGINIETKKYWEERDFNDLEKARLIKDLSLIAWRVIGRMPKPFVQVCGPIATGGLGSVDRNLEAFNQEILKLQNQGLIVFDQMPFEIPMQKIKTIMGNDEARKSIVDDFYKPIFESGFVSTFYFMRNWQSSNGSKWEHDMAQKLNIEIKYL